MFAWTYNAMPDIDPNLIVYNLNVDSKIEPIKQKMRSFAPKNNLVIDDEVEKLLQVSFIRQV